MMNIPKIKHQDSGNFFLLAGPCAIESKDMAEEIAGRIAELSDMFEIPFIFKGSYRKANRSRLDSFTGIGDEKALNILKDIGIKFDVPTITDVHVPDEASRAAHYVDVLQIPAFLCRQTDLLVAAAKTGKVVNIKKGQFVAPDAMQFAVNKVKDSGNDQVWLTERGTFFGFNDLVVDFTGLPVMRQYAPVVLDITHSLQKPNQSSGVTGGKPEMITTMARAGIAVGVDGIFIETHPKPELAKSDGANMLQLDYLEPLLEQLVKLHSLSR